MKIYWLILGLMVAVGAAMATSRRSFVQPMPAATGGFLTDRWYFSNVTETNNAFFTIAFEGTGARIVDWGDGETTTTNDAVTIQHTYVTAASNIFSIRETTGSTTRVRFNIDGSKHRLKRILTEPNGMVNLTSLLSAFQNCTGLIGAIPTLNNLTNLTTIAAAFSGCINLTGPIPSMSALTKLTTLSTTFNTCLSLTGSIPTLGTLTNLTTMASAFNSDFRLTGSIPSLSELTKLTTIAATFQGCSGLTGPIPTLNGLTNLTTIATAFYGCTNLTGSIPSVSELTKLTTMRETFYDCSGLLGNTSTVAYIFGSGSRSNLTTANSCFYALNGTFTNLLGAADDFIKLEKSASFTTNIYSTNGSYRMFYNQTNLTDYATMPADWK